MPLTARDPYNDLPYAEFQDIVDAVKDPEDVFWEGAGADGFRNKDWRSDMTVFYEKAMEFIGGQDDAALGKMFREQVENYFILRAAEKLQARAQVKYLIEDLKQGLAQ